MIKKINYLLRSSNFFVKGDIDGFIGLSLDNLIQILLINHSSGISINHFSYNKN